MSKVVLYLMRHGETIINKAGRVQGWCDGVLTEKGVKMAEDTARGLGEVEFKAAYSSDLGRAVKTARIMLSKNKASKNIELKELPQLREVYCGKYEGEFEKIMVQDILKYLNMTSIEEAVLGISNFEKAYVDSSAAMDETNEAENYDTLINRIMKAVRSISEKALKEGGGNVLVVVHGGMLRTLLKTLGYDEHIFDMENCSVSLVQYENGEFKVLSVNDTSYREKGKSLE